MATGMVGYSGREPTLEAAIAGARRDLQEQLRAYLEWELVRTGKAAAIGADPELRLKEALAAFPTESEMHQETDVTSTTGDTVYRVAMKTRLPSKPSTWAEGQVATLVKQARETDARLSGQRVRGAWTFFSAGILALVIFILYAFLNAGTKGHLAWPLRIVSVAAFLVLCYGLLVIRGHW